MEHHEILLHKTLVGVVRDLEALGVVVTAPMADTIKARLSLALSSAAMEGTRLALLRVSSYINTRMTAFSHR